MYMYPCMSTKIDPLRHHNQANNRPLLFDNVSLLSLNGLMHEIVTEDVFPKNCNFPLFTAIITLHKATSPLITAGFVWPKAPDIEI